MRSQALEEQRKKRSQQTEQRVQKTLKQNKGLMWFTHWKETTWLDLRWMAGWACRWVSIGCWGLSLAMKAMGIKSFDVNFKHTGKLLKDFLWWVTWLDLCFMKVTRIEVDRNRGSEKGVIEGCRTFCCILIRKTRERKMSRVTSAILAGRNGLATYWGGEIEEGREISRCLWGVSEECPVHSWTLVWKLRTEVWTRVVNMRAIGMWEVFKALGKKK